jgi:hypothetical protein
MLRGGTEGNARLTGLTGVVLLILLSVEGVTLVDLRRLLSVHVFVGLLLILPIALKLASTGYRLVRYYTRARGRAVAALARPRALVPEEVHQPFTLLVDLRALCLRQTS